MNQAPLFYPQSKQNRAQDFFRNFWCSDYRACLEHAAREDLYLDCTQCGRKDSIGDDFILLINGRAGRV